MLDEIRELQHLLLSKTRTKYKRYFFDRLHFDRLTGIIGARGVGKTTFLLQYIRQHPLPMSQKLYLSADSVTLASLFDVAKAFQKEGGKLLIIDEIHKFAGFEKELKKIYDFLELDVIFSGSSALKIDNSKADLSRRAVVYEVEGLSFREFLELKTGQTLPAYTLEEILGDHIDIAYTLQDRVDTGLFREYLMHGYYPFYFDKRMHYKLKLNETINTVIEVDIPSIFNIEYQNIRILKKLIGYLCASSPFVPNITTLLQKMNLGSDYRSLYRYLEYLHKAKIITLIRPAAKGDTVFVKPEKIYLNNTNLYYSYCQGSQIGTVREIFFQSMVKVDHTLTLHSKGDFTVDGRYVFEIGGKKKSYRQIKDLPDSFVVADDMEIGSGNKIPLWLFGFLY